MIHIFSLRHSLALPEARREALYIWTFLILPTYFIPLFCVVGCTAQYLFTNPLASYPCHPDTDPLHSCSPSPPNLVEKWFVARLAPDEGWFSLAQRSPKSYIWIKSACLFIRSFLHHVREDGKSQLYFFRCWWGRSGYSPHGVYMEGRYGSFAPCEGSNSGQYVPAAWCTTIGSSWVSFASPASMRAFFDRALDFMIGDCGSPLEREVDRRVSIFKSCVGRAWYG